ncbi:hypothetical protein BASA61_005316 [Batrachochytrium salamandrivorans]|nr:hypothetical protein BASA61_005316 [Batrachochytrium salamandrivorans]
MQRLLSAALWLWLLASSSDMDALDSLSDEQKETLLNYQTITGTDDLLVAVTALENHGWELETTIQTFFHPEQAGNDMPISAQDRHDDDIEQSTDASPVVVPLLPTASSIATAPDMPQRLRGNIQRPEPTLVALFTTPLQWGFKFIWSILTFTRKIIHVGLLPFLGLGPRSRRRAGSTPAGLRNSALAGRSTAESAAVRFKEDFAMQYGLKSPQFYSGTYTQALNFAKREIRYVLAVLQSDEHDDTAVFCRETLASETFINFVSERNLVVWGGNIQEAEAFKVGTVLGVTAYPFMALIAPQGSRMAAVHRFEGLMSTDRIISKLTRLFNRFDVLLAGARADRASHEAARNIRQQQDAAYQSSLLADQEKARKALEEQERERQEQLKQEQERLEVVSKIERRKQYKLELAARMPLEPAVGEPNTTRLSIRLPSGERIIRRFKADDVVQLLWDFIETHDLQPLDLATEFVIVSPYPRRVYRDMTMTLQEAGMLPSASVVVEEKIDDGI